MKINKFKASSDGKKTKKSNKLFKIIILAVVLILVALGGIIASDVFFSDGSPEPVSETVTVTVSGDTLYLNGNSKLTLSELDSYFTQRFNLGNYCTVALINDTQNPADIDTYNAVVDMLAEFGINHQPLTLPATFDEAN